jgi:phospholipase/lecithinase/hemolysin
MKLRQPILITALLVFTVLFSLSAPANNTLSYNQIVIFGDSLSDNGNLYHATLGLIPKSPPYSQGRFSNGQVWSEFAAEYFADKSQVVTANYAVGGETVNFHNPIDGFLPYTFSISLNNYYLRTAFQDKTHTLFIIWLGGNDYLKGAIDPDQATTDVISTIQKNIESLVSAGGKNFLVINLPDLASAPRSSDSPVKDTLHTLTLLHNTKLQAIVSAVKKQHTDITIQLFDVYSVYEDMANNILAYNQKYHTHIKNMTDPCWEGGYSKAMVVKEDEIRRTLEADYRQKPVMNLTGENKTLPDFNAMAHYIAITPDLREAYAVSKSYANGNTACSEPDDYAFWDHIHPSAAIHRIIGSLLIEQINQFYMTRYRYN